MPILDNPKHEAFAQGLARNMKQLDAHAHAGYTPNASAASRLATQPMIADRIEELKKELRQRVQVAVDGDPYGMEQSLEDLGLTMSWVAQQYKEIYEKSLDAASFAAANSAVNSIQKLIEAESGGGGAEEKDVAPTIKINEVTDMLLAVKELVQLGQKEGRDETPLMRDVTPEIKPHQILATQGDSEDDDHPSRES